MVPVRCRGRSSKTSLKTKKTRRGRGLNKSSKRGSNLTIFANNINGLSGKWQSLVSALEYLESPSCVFIQETKLNGRISKKLSGYELFDIPKVSNEGEGLLTAIKSDLDPFLVPGNTDHSNILLVDFKVGDQRFRTINAHGPQECDFKEKIIEFWVALEQEVVRAEDDGALVLMELDANAKLGHGLISGDPHAMSNNGKLLYELLQRQNLECLNLSPACVGKITRSRHTVKGIECSILDYVIVSRFLSHFLVKMIIDEEKEFAMIKYATLKGHRMKKESDHNSIFAQFSIKIPKRQKENRREIFDFKNIESQKLFREYTENCQELENCFKGIASPKTKSVRFFKELDNAFHRTFQKIRIRRCGNVKAATDEGKMIILRSKLQRVKSENTNVEVRDSLDKKIEFLDHEISRVTALKNAEIIRSNLKQIDSLDGSFNQLGMWKLKQRLIARQSDPPTIKKDSTGKWISAPSALKDLYLRTYQTRLEHRTMKEEYIELKLLKEELWNIRYEQLKNNPSGKWSLKDLITVTKTLKNGKSRDPNGLIAEVFKPGVAGKSLQLAVLDLLNSILESFTIPDEMLAADITSIWKRKGSQTNLDNDRGIFVLGVLRKILDKMLYIHFYNKIDSGMSCSNIGARKNRNVRNHLFMVYGIINSVIREKRDCIDILIYDLVQAFDSLWLADCMNDLYDILPPNMRDRKLALVYECNKHNLVAVNTPVGLTDRVDIPEIVQQGGGWGPLECSVNIDTIGRLCRQSKNHIYRYRDAINVIPLAMVDDLLGIANCGLESVALNSFINVQIEMKKLRFHTVDQSGKSKCHRIHVGKKSNFCPSLKIHGTPMQTVKSDTYLGDIISHDGSNKLNIESRVMKGVGKIAEVMAVLQKLNLGKHYFKIGVILRESIFVSSLLANAEVWYRLVKADLNELESLDRKLLKRICGLPSSAPTAAIYLELGLMRISTIIKARRVNYLHYLAQLSRSEMLSKFFRHQWHEGKEYDWCYQVKCDLRELDLPVELVDIEGFSKTRWKNMVRRKTRIYEFNALLELKGESSKLKNLSYSSLTLQSYLSDMEASKAKNVLRYRTRTSDYSGNNKGMGTVKLCPLCGTHDDTQELAFQCPEVLTNIQMGAQYSDVFASDVTLEVADTLEKMEKLRKTRNVS